MNFSHQQVDFIRHGESLGNLRTHHVDGQNLEVSLSSRGMQQARLLGRMYPLSKDTVLVSSAAERAKQTAALAFPQHLLEGIDSRFVEMSQGLHEGKLRRKVYTPKYRAEIDELGWSHKAPEGESLDEVADRMIDGIDEWAELSEGSPLVIVSHATAIKSLIGRINGLSQYETVHLNKIDNTQVSRLSRYGSGWSVDFIGLDAAVVAAEDRKNK